MRKKGYLYICARCAEKEFIEDDAPRSGDNLPCGWGMHQDKHLCPNCHGLYNEALNRFFAPEVRRKLDLEV